MFLLRFYVKNSNKHRNLIISRIWLKIVKIVDFEKNVRGGLSVTR